MKMGLMAGKEEYRFEEREREKSEREKGFGGGEETVGERNLCLGEKKMQGRKVVERESGLIFSIDQISPSHGTLVFFVLTFCWGV